MRLMGEAGIKKIPGRFLPVRPGFFPCLRLLGILLGGVDTIARVFSVNAYGFSSPYVPAYVDFKRIRTPSFQSFWISSWFIQTIS